MKCNNCGNDLSVGMKFCSECGEKIVIEEIKVQVEEDLETIIKHENDPNVNQSQVVINKSSKADFKKKILIILSILIVIGIYPTYWTLQNISFDGSGYNIFGYDGDGRDREGYDKNGWNSVGWNIDGYNKKTGTLFDETGRDRGGYDKNGWSDNKINKYTQTEYNQDGYDYFGFNEEGWNKKGINRDTKTKFDIIGYDMEGYDKSGFDKDGWSKQDINKYTGTEKDSFGCYHNAKEPYVGMSMDELVKSTWGEPEDINKTTNAYGTSEQWCYDGYKYVYVEDGVVTSIQD